MNEPLPTWVGWIILLTFVPAMVWLLVWFTRYDRRRQAEKKAAAVNKAFEALAGGPLSDRQKELLQHGVLPWYEFPGLWGGQDRDHESNAIRPTQTPPDEEPTGE